MAARPSAWEMWTLVVGATVAWVVAAVLVAWALRAVGRMSARAHPELESAVDVLERRCAAGEIDEVKFQGRKLVLAGVPTRPGSTGHGSTLRLVTGARSGREIGEMD